MSDRVVESRSNLNSLSPALIKSLCDALLEELGEPEAEIEKTALTLLIEGDYTKAKEYCLMAPTSSYLAAISCLASAYRSPMVADSVLRDAARHTAEVAKHRAEARINDRFAQIMLRAIER